MLQLSEPLRGFVSESSWHYFSILLLIPKRTFYFLPQLRKFSERRHQEAQKFIAINGFGQIATPAKADLR